MSEGSANSIAQSEQPPDVTHLLLRPFALYLQERGFDEVQRKLAYFLLCLIAVNLGLVCLAWRRYGRRIAQLQRPRQKARKNQPSPTSESEPQKEE